MRLLSILTLALFGTATAAPTTCANVQAALKGPTMTSYQMVTKDRTIAGQVLKGKTTISTTAIKPIQDGVQISSTDGKTTNVMKTTCVNGKTRLEVNGKPVSTDTSSASKEVQATGENLKNAADFDYTKHKVGDTWGGKLSSVNTESVSSESSYQNKFVSEEKITTPAGTFDTYKVQSKITVKMVFKNMPKNLKMPNQNSTTTTTTWYAKNTPGLIVKSVSDSMTMTLLKYQK